MPIDIAALKKCAKEFNDKRCTAANFLKKEALVTYYKSVEKQREDAILTADGRERLLTHLRSLTAVDSSFVAGLAVLAAEPQPFLGTLFSINKIGKYRRWAIKVKKQPRILSMARVCGFFHLADTLVESKLKHYQDPPAGAKRLVRLADVALGANSVPSDEKAPVDEEPVAIDLSACFGAERVVRSAAVASVANSVLSFVDRSLLDCTGDADIEDNAIEDNAAVKPNGGAAAIDPAAIEPSVFDGNMDWAESDANQHTATATVGAPGASSLGEDVFRAWESAKDTGTGPEGGSFIPFRDAPVFYSSSVAIDLDDQFDADDEDEDSSPATPTAFGGR